MLNVVGKLMEACAWLVRYLTFDAHCSHAWFREALFGTYDTVKESDLSEVPFFRNLKHKPLPEHALPFFPLRLAEYDGLPVAALPGVCFSEFVSVSGILFLVEDVVIFVLVLDFLESLERETLETPGT
eukprot:s131_g41.t1